MRTEAEQFADLVKAASLRGHIGFIDTACQVDLAALRDKGLTVHGESMWATLVHGSAETAGYARVLGRIAEMTSTGMIPPLVTHHLHGRNAETLRMAHRTIRRGQMIGKLVISLD